MRAMRTLVAKDLRILRRSPLLVGLLVVYPIAIALLIGFGLSSPPGKPRVALLSELPLNRGTIDLAGHRVDLGGYARQLLGSIDAVKVRTREQAIAKVRDGEALGALIIPADLPDQVRGLVQSGTGSPSVELILNSRDPLQRQYVDQAIDARVSAVDRAISTQVLDVAVSDLQQVLNGGTVDLLGDKVPLLGLRNARTIVRQAITTLPASSPVRVALVQVAAFATLAIEGLAFARPALGAIVSPLTVNRTELAGLTTPTDTYAVAIAVVVSLMFTTLLLAAGLLAAEREEGTWQRLTRGLASPSSVLAAKALLSAACGSALCLAMSAGLSASVRLDWARLPLWCVGLACGALAFSALGVLLGTVAREVRAASLIAVLVSLPVAFVALVPSTATGGGVRGLLDVVAFVFPFRAALEALSNAFTGAAPGPVMRLLHLLVLAFVYGALARAASRRFA